MAAFESSFLGRLELCSGSIHRYVGMRTIPTLDIPAFG